MSNTRSGTAYIAAVTTLALVLAGCGGSHRVNENASKRPSHAQPVCAPAARKAMAHALSVRSARLSSSRSIAGNAMPQCAFAARLPGGPRVAVTVNVDNGPQPYFVLERTIVETAQIWPQRGTPAPQNVAGLGLEAAWFPAGTDLEATDGRLLITATVAWPGGGAGRERALARAMTVPYLRTPHGSSAERLAKGFPAPS